MTSIFYEKSNQVIKCDICVVVDNYVEIGDFFRILFFEQKKSYIFFDKKCKTKNSKT